MIGSAFEIANVLGAGFLEKVYERALIRELALRGVRAKAQVSFPVCYKGQYVGEYMADLVVEEKLIVELKCVDRFANEHLAQCINYLKASGQGSRCSSIFKGPKWNGSVSSWTRSACPGHHPNVCLVISWTLH